MKKNLLIYILRKYLKGNENKEEHYFVNHIYGLFDDAPDLLEDSNAADRALIKDRIKENIWKEIDALDKHIQWKIWMRRGIVVTVGAAAILLLIFGANLFYNKGDINLSPYENQVVAQYPVPTDIFLPDGSKVRLNADSKLSYLPSFEKSKTREVYLEGEAFFTIQHNEKKPFIVHTGSVDAVVLGTSFDIKALKGDTRILVTVSTGKVLVKDQHKVFGVLEANQQMEYNKNNVSSKIATIDAERYLHHQDQKLSFDNLTMSEVSKLLEEKYKVQIFIKDTAISAVRFTTTFQSTVSLKECLTSICSFNGWDFECNPATDSILITRRKK